jgi:hypothetical protein
VQIRSEVMFKPTLTQFIAGIAAAVTMAVGVLLILVPEQERSTFAAGLVAVVLGTVVVTSIIAEAAHRDARARATRIEHNQALIISMMRRHGSDVDKMVTLQMRTLEVLAGDTTRIPPRSSVRRSN